MFAKCVQGTFAFFQASEIRSDKQAAISNLDLARRKTGKGKARKEKEREIAETIIAFYGGGREHGSVSQHLLGGLDLSLPLELQLEGTDALLSSRTRSERNGKMFVRLRTSLKKII